MYFGEFFECAHPNAYESITNDLLKEDDPDNDLGTLFPVISFLDYSQPMPWPKGLPAVPFSDITCNFRVEFGRATSSAWHNLPATPIPLNGDCNAKFEELYKKKTGKDDETFSKSRYLICPDTTKLPLMGDGIDCNGSGPCIFYTFKIHKHRGSTAHCNRIDQKKMFFSIGYIDPKLTVDDFHNPWGYRIDTLSSRFSPTKSKLMVIDHFYTTLETDAQSFGLRAPSKIEKKLVVNLVPRKDESHFARHGHLPYLQVM